MKEFLSAENITPTEISFFQALLTEAQKDFPDLKEENLVIIENRQAIEFCADEEDVPSGYENLEQSFLVGL